LHFDLSLNSLYSRDPLCDLFAINSAARTSIAFNGNLCNILADVRDKNNNQYSTVIPDNEEHKPEIERHRDFLEGIGISVSKLEPAMWLKSEDEEFAERFFRDNNLDPKNTMCMFAGAQNSVRIYKGYGTAIAEICREYGLSVIGLGSPADTEINIQNLDATGVSTINLSGKTTIRQTAAILKCCRLAVGAETGLAHMACAVGTPNVIILGGGHFGRFMPYFPLTSIVCLPLGCYGCNWHCRYGKVHCVEDIRPEVMATAITESLEKASEIPRVFAQESSLWDAPEGMPQWRSFEKHLDPKKVEIIYIGKDEPALESDGVYRQKEIDAGWQRTEDRGQKKDVENQQLEWDGNMINIGSPEDLYQTAQGFVENGREKEAIGALRVFLGLYPDYALAYNDLGVLYYSDGDKEKALSHYQQAVRLEPENATFQKNLAEFYYVEAGRVEEALQIYIKLLDANPTDTETLLILGQICESLRKVEDAKVFYNKVLEIDSRNANAIERLRMIE
jgi:TolA-binding protein